MPLWRRQFANSSMVARRGSIAMVNGHSDNVRTSGFNSLLAQSAVRRHGLATTSPLNPVADRAFQTRLANDHGSTTVPPHFARVYEKAEEDRLGNWEHLSGHKADFVHGAEWSACALK